jgi:Uncharacterized protein conserved in bacteria
MAIGADKRAFALRVRAEVLTAVEKLAAADLRSVNAEIEVLLREALARRGITLDGRAKK